MQQCKQHCIAADTMQASATVQAEGADHCEGTSSCKLQGQALQ